MQKSDLETCSGEGIRQFHEGTGPPVGLKESILNTVIILAAGFLLKSIIRVATKNPVKQLLGSTFIFGVSNIAAKNPETMRSIRKGFLKLVRKKPVRTVPAT